MTASPRALMPDYLRLYALFGVVVNVQYTRSRRSAASPTQVASRRWTP